MLIALAALTIPIVAANHGQTVPTTSQGDATVTFDHTTGNEYWVQARITSTHSIAYANVRHESGQFQDFGQSGWDSSEYAIGMRVPPGERVQFQVLLNDDADYVTSCFFTHPAGVEQCDQGSTADFQATFRNPSGNEWWQQIYIDANRPLHFAGFDSWGVNGGTDRPLSKKDWGAYAGSYHQPSGSIIQFWAVAGDESARSSCYEWPSARVIECPGEETGPYQPIFDARSGNEWWVDVAVGPREPQFVFARDEGGAWVQLQKKSWGSWAASFHVEPGNKVQFMAHQDDGRFESCWFTHPQGMTPQNDQTCHGGYVGPTNPFA